MKALYALSGDPPTKGHECVIYEMAKVFDELHIALAVNPDKHYMFDEGERAAMMRAITEQYGNRVKLYSLKNQILVKFAKTIGVTHLVRGIRSSKDYEYERAMFQINKEIEPSITTWFIFPPPQVEHVSSSFVKGLLGLEGWEDIAAKYVHPFVLKKLKSKLPASP